MWAKNEEADFGGLKTIKLIISKKLTKIISTKFIASALNITELEAAKKLMKFIAILGENAIKQASKSIIPLEIQQTVNPIEVDLYILSNIITDNAIDQYERLKESPPDSVEASQEQQHKNNAIEELCFLFYKAFPSYYDRTKKTSSDTLSEYLKIRVNYELGNQSLQPLVQKQSSLGGIRLENLTFNFTIDNEDTSTKEIIHQHIHCFVKISKALSEIQIPIHTDENAYNGRFPTGFSIHWFFVPMLNSRLDAIINSERNDNSFTLFAPQTTSSSNMYGTIFYETSATRRFPELEESSTRIWCMEK